MKKSKKFISQKFVPQFAEINTQDDQFAALLDTINTNHVKEGTVVKGQVVSVGDEVIVVDVGVKNEGRIPLEEFKSDGLELPQVGDIVDVYVKKIEDRFGNTILSRIQAIAERFWVELEEAHSKNENVKGYISERIKGGFVVNLGHIKAFLPGSHLDVRPVKDVTSLIGVMQPFMIVKMDKKHNNVVVSRRAILEESRSEARNEMLATIQEGMELKGIVKNITDYGAFIDLGNVDGLLHLTDMSWSRINHPSEMVVIGQQINVVVVKYNEDTKRISLGLKQLDSNPWESIKNDFPVGTKMTGKVTNIADYGGFIELKPGVEGLVHSSEIGWLRSQQYPKRSLSINQEVEFVILEVDTVKHRISLSIKQTQDHPLVKFAEENAVGSIISVAIKNITDAGIVVNLDNGIEGFINENDLSWDDNNADLLKQYKKGEEIKCMILAIDVEKEKVKLGIKQLNEADKPAESKLDQFKKGTAIKGSITAIKADGIEVEIASGDEMVNGFIKKTELSSEKAEQNPENFAVGQDVEANVTGVDKKANRILLSIKSNELAAKDKVIKAYSSVSDTSLGDLLGAVLQEDKVKK